jgi:carboxymethylenebutenolidase
MPAMITIDVRTPEGTMQTHLHTPSSGGRHPAVILYYDAYSVRPVMHDIARQLANDGYVVALPNVFYRAGDYKPFDPKNTFNNPSERARVMSIMQQASVPAVTADTGALLDVLDARPEVTAGRAGVFGYCMGGRLAFAAACHFGERIAAIASFHGGHIVGNDETSPHRQAYKIKARVYLGVADEDASCTPAHQGILATALGEAHVRYAIELYQGKHHGFAVSDHSTYDAGANAQHWLRLRELFAAELPAA